METEQPEIKVNMFSINEILRSLVYLLAAGLSFFIGTTYNRIESNIDKLNDYVVEFDKRFIKLETDFLSHVDKNESWIRSHSLGDDAQKIDFNRRISEDHETLKSIIVKIDDLHTKILLLHPNDEKKKK